MTFVSYAQNFEDVILWRALQHVSAGRYIDIGAQEPEFDSVSFAFYKAGWRGIHVEPTPGYAAKLREARPDEIVIEAAVADVSGPIPFFELGGLSSGREDIAEHHSKSGHQPRRIVVPTVGLDHLLDLSEGDVHWLKIDVEGMEEDVLRSWRTSAKRPWVLVIESTYPTTEETTEHRWIDEVRTRGYKEAFFDGLSRYFVHEAHAELADRLGRPANVFDDFQITSEHFSAALMRAEAEARQQASDARIAALRLDVAQVAQRSQAAEAELARERTELAHVKDLFDQLDERSSGEREARARLGSELLRIARLVGNDPDEHDGVPGDPQSVPPGTTFVAVKARLEAAREELERARDLALQQYVSGQKSRDSEVGHLSGRISALEHDIADARSRLAQGQRDQDQLQSTIDEQARALAVIRSDADALGRQLVQARRFVSSIYGTKRGKLASWLKLVPRQPSEAQGASDPEHRQPIEKRNPEGTSEVAQQSGMDISVNDIRHTSNLLALNGSAFVDALYRAFLKRSADRAGRDHYIARLQAGDAKEKILLAVATSPEARAVGAKIDGLPGLQSSWARRRRWKLFSPGARAMDAGLNRLEYNIGEAYNSLANRLDRMESSLEQIQARLESSGPVRSLAQARETGVYVQGVPVSIKRGVSMRPSKGPAEFIEQLRESVQSSSEALSLRNGR